MTPTALGVVRKELKKRQDSIESFEKGDRPELAAKEKAEAEILAAYLPQAAHARGNRRARRRRASRRPARLPKRRWAR